MAFQSTTPTIGVNLGGTDVSAILADGTTSGSPSFQMGTRVLGSDGTEWQYRQTPTAIMAFCLVAISTSGTIGKASVADAMAGRQLAFAQNTFAANEWGWVALRGTGGPNNAFKVMVNSTATSLAALYVSSTTGVLSTQGSSSATVAGIFLAGASGSATTTTTAMACIATWPKVQFSGTLGQQGI